MGLITKTNVRTLSSSGRRMTTTFGTSKKKTRHIQSRLLYMQELCQNGNTTPQKAPGERDPSNIRTKFIKTDILHKHMHKFNMVTTKSVVFTTCTLFVGHDGRH